MQNLQRTVDEGRLVLAGGTKLCPACRFTLIADTKERCTECQAEREITLAHGYGQLTRGRLHHDEDADLLAFLHIFHPERAPQSIAETRRLRE